MTAKVPARWGDFAHIEPYWLGNSIPGLDLAVRRGYRAVDLDGQCTLDLIIINVHGSAPEQDGFYDPRGIIPASTPWRLIPWRDAARFRRRNGQRVQTMRRMIREAHRRGLRVELEAKISVGLEDPRAWRPIARTVRRLGADVQVKTLMTLPPGPRPAARLRAVHTWDLTTIALPRSENGFAVRREWRPFIDHYRGQIRWV